MSIIMKKIINYEHINYIFLFKIKFSKIIFLFIIFFTSNCLGSPFPIKTPILNPQEQPIAEAWVYIDYVEIYSLNNKMLGKIGIVNLEGNFLLFLVKENNQKTLVGSAANRKIYNSNDQLIGYYGWTTFWAFAYSPEGKKLGLAKCIAYRGVCAAGIAGYLTGLLDKGL